MTKNVKKMRKRLKIRKKEAKIKKKIKISQKGRKLGKIGNIKILSKFCQNFINFDKKLRVENKKRG